MNTLSRTWQLFQQSFSVLSQEPSLLLFPVLSAISAVFLAAGFFVPIYQVGTFQAIAHHRATWVDYVPLASWYYANTFVVVFFNSALAACVNLRLAGGNPSLGDGVRVALSRVHRIAAWSLVSATVGLLLQAVENASDKWGRLVTSLVGAGWTMVTYLMIPVLIIEDRTVGGSVRRSADILRKTWGEQITGSFGFGLLGLLLCLPGVVGGLMLCRLDVPAGIILAVVYILMVAAISSAVKGIFTVALYHYGAEGRAPLGFSAESLRGPAARPNWSSSPW